MSPVGAHAGTSSPRPVEFPMKQWLWAVALFAGEQGFAQTALTVEAGVPLHVTLTRTASMKVGAPVVGVLAQPVWVYDRMAWPRGTVVRGEVASLEPLGGEDRLRARLDGDLTPLKKPVLRWTSMEDGETRIALDAEGMERDTQPVRFNGPKKKGLREIASSLVREKWATVQDQVLAPGKGDRAKRLLYSQLPYHPQRVWRGTEFVADLRQPVKLDPPKEQSARLVDAAELAGSLPPETTVRARLVTALDSDSTKQGTPVTALVTEPVWSANKRLILPEGAQLQGTVLRAR